MVSAKGTLLIAIMTTVLLDEIVAQRLTLCPSPEKNSYCKLECETTDFSQIVGFQHPPGTDVGACVPQKKCNSGIDHRRYNVTQTEIAGKHVTQFHIENLNRTFDEGQWVCLFGSEVSSTETLRVHTRPENIHLTLTQSKIDIEVKCSCSCVYPSDNFIMEIQISNEERKTGTDATSEVNKKYEIRRRFQSLTYTNISGNSCEHKEKSVTGMHTIPLENWCWRYVDVKCICTEEVLFHMLTEQQRHYPVVPEEPRDFQCQIESPTSVIATWMKGSNGGHKQRFYINIKSKDGKMNETIVVQSSTNQYLYNKSIIGLEPEKSYLLYISAENENGFSGKVGPSCLKTPADKFEDVHMMVWPSFGIALLSLLIVLVSACLFRRQIGKEICDACSRNWRNAEEYGPPTEQPKE